MDRSIKIGFGFFFFAKTRALVLLFLLVLAGPLTAPSLYGADDPISIIKEIGFEPIDQVAADLTFTNLDDGAKVELKRFRGNWVWLIVWATWCPACREQIPMLETAHLKLAPKGLAVIGVLTDETPSAQLKNNPEVKNVTFELMHDLDGSVSRHYQVSGIPVSYLIAPDGRHVGVSRGVLPIEQSAKLALLERLLAIKSVPVTANQTQGAGIQQAPTNLPPPELKLEILGLNREGRAEVSRPLTLRVNVLWSGDSGLYLLKPPKITLPAGVTIGELALESSSGGRQGQVFYSAPLFIEKPGDYTIGPVELAYEARSGVGAPALARTSGETLSVVKPPLAVKTTVGLIVVTSVMLGAAVYSLYSWRRRKKQDQICVQQREQKRRNDVDQRFSELLKMKLKGDGAAYELGLTELVFELLTDEEKVRGEWSDLKKFLEKLKYARYRMERSQQHRFETRVRGFLGEVSSD